MRRAAIVAAMVALLLTLAAPAVAHHPIDPWLAALFGGTQPALMGGPGGPVRVAEEATAAAVPGEYGDCGPDALPETGLQGQVPRSDQESGRSKLGYRCNLRLVGQNDVDNRGANFQLGWYRDCAYVGIVGNQFSQGPASPAEHPLEGVAVIDLSDPRHPQLVRLLKSPVGRT